MAKELINDSFLRGFKSNCGGWYGYNLPEAYCTYHCDFDKLNAVYSLISVVNTIKELACVPVINPGIIKATYTCHHGWNETAFFL